MLEQILNAITNNPWILAIGTVAFFAIKGTIWLLIPYFVVRWRKSVTRRRNENNVFHSEAQTVSSESSFKTQTKRAA